MDGSVEPHQQRLALDEREADVEVAGKPVGGVAVEIDLVELGEDSLPGPLAQAQLVLGVLGPTQTHQLARLAQTDDARNVQRPGPHAALVTAAVDDRGQADPRALRSYVQRADALGAVD